MKKINFKPTSTVGDEHIMSLNGMVAKGIAFNYKTREIFVIYEDVKVEKIKKIMKEADSSIGGR